MVGRGSWPRRCLLLACVLAGPSATAGQPPATPGSRPVAATRGLALELPDPDLSRLDAGVRAQLAGLGRAARDLAAGAAPDPLRLAGAIGALGHLYSAYEMRPEAEQCYQTAGRLSADDPRWPYHLGLLLRGAGDLEGAAREIERARVLAPDDVTIAVRLGDLELALGRVERARVLFERAAAADPEAAAAWYGLGRAAAARGADADAIAHLSRAAALLPGGSLADYALAQAYRRAGDEAQARRALERYRPFEVPLDDPYEATLEDISILAAFELLEALAADADVGETKLLGYALSMLAATEGAVERLLEDLEAGAGDDAAAAVATRARLHYVAGGLLVQRNRQQEAIGQLERALELEPRLLAARVELANTLARQGRFEGALGHFDRALEAAPDAPELRVKRAAVLQRLERWAEAAADLRVAVERNPAGVEARYRLALSLERLGDVDGTIDALRAAAAIDADGGRAARALQRAGVALARRGALEEAVATLERAVALDPGLAEAQASLDALRRELTPPRGAHEPAVSP